MSVNKVRRSHQRKQCIVSHQTQTAHKAANMDTPATTFKAEAELFSSGDATTTPQTTSPVVVLVRQCPLNPSMGSHITC